MSDRARRPRIADFAPGILLAATGVGAGDLLTAALGGAEAGLGLLWAVVVGAILKWVLTEGIARWQLATGTTVLEGWSSKLGGWIRWFFLGYLALFALVVGAALVSACGVGGAAIWPLGDLETSRMTWGVIHSLVGLALVWYGSFEAFEKLMAALVGLMFVTVVTTAVAVAPNWTEVAAGFVPQMPASGSSWVLAVLGGVGGTVTLLLYGYWIQEQDRAGRHTLSVCRLDLAVGNGVTALFGLAVIIIGSRLELAGSGSGLAIEMAEQLASALGPIGRWVFLAGFWAAVFSSLLGVWQGIPYLFADAWTLGRPARPQAGPELRSSRPYRVCLVLIALLPFLFLAQPVRQVQLLYGIFGAIFLPLLALTLLILNNRRKWVGASFRSPALFNLVLVLAVALFAYLGFS